MTSGELALRCEKWMAARNVSPDERSKWVLEMLCDVLSDALEAKQDRPVPGYRMAVENEEH